MGEESSAKLEWAKKARMQLLQEASNSECVEGCKDEWLLWVMEILHNKGICALFFNTAVKTLLKG